MGAIKKVSLIVSHSDVVNVISELLYLGCFEPIEPRVFMDPPELGNYIKTETMDLDVYEANKDSITLLTTQNTYTLIGWVPEEYEPEIANALSEFVCAMFVEEPNPDLDEFAPVYMKHPQLFGKFRSSGRNVFEPLTRKNNFL